MATPGIATTTFFSLFAELRQKNLLNTAIEGLKEYKPL
jgi:hypothetical protein